MTNLKREKRKKKSKKRPANFCKKPTSVIRIILPLFKGQVLIFREIHLEKQVTELRKCYLNFKLKKLDDVVGEGKHQYDRDEEASAAFACLQNLYIDDAFEHLSRYHLI